ncbi:hypothetical protein FGB62_87g045 [Gracilaria domingensis]|nr:hypothetical protein FGB62_87g045 [Gracilaria domingensis]
MAFLTHPPLPARGTRSLSPSIAIPTRFDDRAALVVSRRRRVYGVLSVSSASPAGSTARIETICSVSKRDEVRRALLGQIQQRNEELKQSNKNCDMAFKAELDSLSTPLPAPEPPVEPKSVKLDPTHELPSAPEPELLPAPEQRELLTQAPQREKLVGAPEPTETTKEPDLGKLTNSERTLPLFHWSPYIPIDSATKTCFQHGFIADTKMSQSTGVEELYSPPRSEPKEEPLLERAFQTISRTVETIVEETRDNIDDVIESLTESKKDPIPKDLKEEKTPAQEPEEPQSEPKERSIGKVLLDAIVEGVPSKPKEENDPAVDKSDLIFLVDSGKIKNLTVSKLRRLLSTNNLKTSGRKAELIARLTSFAKNENNHSIKESNHTLSRSAEGQCHILECFLAATIALL